MTESKRTLALQFLQEVEDRAEKATRGPWISKTERMGQFLETEIRIKTGGTLFRSTSYGTQTQDGEYIARMDPPTALKMKKALVEAVDALDFYGDKEMYMQDCELGDITEWELDCYGNKAREALTQIFETLGDEK